MANPQFETMAEDALMLRFGERIDATLNDRVHAAAALLQRALPSLECVPAYASVLLRFDPLTWLDDGAVDPQQRLRTAVRAALTCEPSERECGHEHLVPACYSGSFAPDITEVAAHTGLSTDDIITRHAAASYRVAMIGFAPGFPYLLGLDPALAMPRRGDPRQRVPAGSVAIGGQQTGIYPATLPGGWQLIGRTPLRLFDLAAIAPSLLAPGDRVRFRAIDEAEFDRLAAAQPS